MKTVCFYFQVHQPHRLKKYKVFDIGNNDDYFDHELNKNIMDKVSRKCYLHANRIILHLLKNTKMKVAYSITGIALEQLENFSPETLNSFIEIRSEERR